MNVRRLLGVAPLIVAAIPVVALARDCNEVKAEIDAKIKAKGVTSYDLQIVNGPEVHEGQTVGNCEAGAKRIVYFRLGDPSASRVPATEKAQKNKVAELSPSATPGGNSSPESGFVDRAETLLSQPPDSLLSQSCAVGNWTGTPRC
jgi:Protein of unknown function (DUF1161)